MLWGLGTAFAGLGVASLIWTVRALGQENSAGSQAGILGFAVSAVGLLLSAASLAVAWLSYRADRREGATAVSVTSVADAFAVAVGGEWEAEAQLRRLNDPYPLPVSWRAAPAGLAEQWADLTRHLRLRAPMPQVDLAGRDDEIGNLFLDRLPLRRLVVLGDPGSGKSMLLVRLLLDLCARRADGDPVPVLFSLSSWDPAACGLEEWMEQRLRTDHPALAAEYGRTTQARALLEHRLVLPMLDGFDEMAPSARAVALDAINRALPASCPVVLSSRTDEYRQALNSGDGVPVRLTGAAAIVLDPLDAVSAAAYLVRDAGGSGTESAERWSSIVSELGSCSPVGQVLDTPLALFLARTIYNPRPGEGAGRLPNPGELCDQIRFPDAQVLRTHLFEAYVPAAYRPHPHHPCVWTAEQAHRYLTFLAKHLHGLGGAVDIAWWELAHGLPRGMLTLLKGFAVGAVWWLILVIFTPIYWWLSSWAISYVDGMWRALELVPVLAVPDSVWSYFYDAPETSILWSLAFVLLTALPSTLLGGVTLVVLSRVGVRESPASRLRWRPDAALARRVLVAGAVSVAALDARWGTHPWELRRFLSPRS